ncbi:hypothetical protein QAD02_020593 [Eretmocerus hayati]|uniref:Uncharacterized protein n=1 Tax=Eretmocerus hayati TaxID=131215 RepID=A0ACC2PMZ4_9HYME|nr:hypothetical protein QAD02_020593 [Eretmocerus hayati]
MSFSCYALTAIREMMYIFHKGQTYPKTGQTVVVHYTGIAYDSVTSLFHHVFLRGSTAMVFLLGTLSNGKKFDSSRDRGVPFKFKIGKGEVIKGWDQGVAQMCVGERARLTCPPEVAYGSRGHPGVYPLIFHI